MNDRFTIVVGGGRGLIDFDSDGVDDVSGFADYSWQKQGFLVNGGTVAEFHALEYHMRFGYGDSSGEREHLGELLSFHRLGVTYSEDRETAACFKRPGYSCGGGETDGVIYLNRNLKGPNLLFRRDSWLSFALAHERFHLIVYEAGQPYGGPAEEREASCLARDAVGYHPPGIIGGCY